jgi:hypothetical protein
MALMKLQVKIALVTFVVIGVVRATAQDPAPAPNADLPGEAVAAQQDKGDKKKPADKDKKKDKGKDKEKEKTPPLALSELLPQEGRLDLTELPLAPEMLGNFGPTGILYTIPPQFTRLPDRTILAKQQLANGRIIFVPVVIPGATVPVPGTGGRGFLPVGVGGFKIADNNSPMPQDRIYLDFNFFNDFLASTNNRLGTGIQNMNIYRESFGLEKTFLDGNGSVGLILPLNTLSMQSPVSSLNGTHTGLGDLSLFARYALYGDRANNNWISGGLAVTAPTGSSNFAGIDAPSPVANTTILQPFGSYLWNFGNLYVQGFISIYTPTDHGSSPVLLFNDIGIGYFVYRAPVADRWLTGVAPTFEVHVTDPLNFRGPITASNPFGAFDVVDLGVGLNVLLRARSRLGIGVVTPVTGPRPFTIEALAQFRVRF